MSTTPSDGFESPPLEFEGYTIQAHKDGSDRSGWFWTDDEGARRMKGQDVFFSTPQEAELDIDSYVKQKRLREDALE